MNGVERGIGHRTRFNGFLLPLVPGVETPG